MHPDASKPPSAAGRRPVAQAWAALALTMAAQAAAQPAVDPSAAQVIRFASGRTQAEVRGRLQGRADAEYRVDAAAGQTLSVELRSRQPSLNFNVLPPGSEEAMFIGSTAGSAARLRLPTDGSYRIRLYLMRNAARRGAAGTYALQVAVDGQALPPLSSAQDARVAGTPFHATARLRCQTPASAAPGDCAAGVVRRGHDGTATVELRGGGTLRRLLFVHGALVATDSAQDAAASRQGDTSTVTIGGDERYEVPDALLNGG